MYFIKSVYNRVIKILYAIVGGLYSRYVNALSEVFGA